MLRSQQIFSRPALKTQYEGPSSPVRKYHAHSYPPTCFLFLLIYTYDIWFVDTMFARYFRDGTAIPSALS